MSSAQGNLSQGEAPARVARTDHLIALAVLAVAFVARLIFLFTSPDRDWPHSTFYEGDAIVWVDWAIALDEGGVYQFDLPIHPPAIAYTIAWLYDGVRVTGFLGMKVLWSMMSAAACALTFLACTAVMSRRAAVIATLLLVFSFNQYVLATSLNNETPYLLMLTIIVLLTQRAISTPSRWTIIMLGIAHGCAMLLRAEHPLLLVMLTLWLVITGGSQAVQPRPRLRQRVPPAAAVGLIALLVCLPWSIHATLATHRFNTLEPAPIPFNLAPVEWDDSAQQALNALPAFARSDNFAAVNYFAQKRLPSDVQGVALNGSDIIKLIHGEFGWIPRPLPTFVLVSNQGPFSFALANHPNADGGFSRAALAHPMRGSDPTFAFAFPPHNRVFTDGWRVGWEEIRADPAQWRRNVVRKFQRFADGITCGFGAANLPLGRSGVREPVDMLVSDSTLAKWWQPLILAVIATGIVVALARRMSVGPWLLLIIYKIIVTLAFYGYARQGASIAPAFFVFIAITLDSLLQLIDRRWPRWIHAQAWFAIAIIAAMMIADVVWSRRGEHLAINGPNVTRPDLGPGPPIAFQAFNRIEIRAAP